MVGNGGEVEPSASVRPFLFGGRLKIEMFFFARSLSAVLVPRAPQEPRNPGTQEAGLARRGGTASK